MGRFVIKEPGKDPKWIKDLDTVNGKMTFTSDRSKAFKRSGDFYTRCQYDTIKRFYIDDYPELAHLQIDSDW